MNIKNILFTALTGVTLLFHTSCMDGEWEAPASENPPYGNAQIDTTANLITIADLKSWYPKYAENYTCTEMTREGMLKCYVTGNDIQGNLYNSIAVQDENGDALIIAIGENSLFAYLPVGQELVISTKGLYIGGYGSQPQIGYPYTNSAGNTYVSRMTSTRWQQHFRLLKSKKTDIQIPEYTLSEFQKLNIQSECGKLMTIKNVQVEGADGKMTWASEEQANNNAVTLYFKGASRNIQVYTSCYSDFANAVVPTGSLNLTGIWKRYNNYWELILRSEEDIKKAN